MCTADLETGEPPVEAISRTPIKLLSDPMLLDGHLVQVCRLLVPP